MMIEITYVSRATEPMPAEQLLALLQQCRKNNTARGVTGMLVYGNATFLQALEGEETILDGLVERIRKDPRHTDIQLLRRGPIANRQYSDWSMGFKRVSDTELKRVEGLRNFGEKDFTFQNLSQHGDVVESLMDYYRMPFSDDVARELDERDRIIEHLEHELAEIKGSVEVACLILESVVDAAKKGALSEGHIELCRSALDGLKQV